VLATLGAKAKAFKLRRDPRDAAFVRGLAGETRRTVSPGRSLFGFNLGIVMRVQMLRTKRQIARLAWSNQWGDKSPHSYDNHGPSLSLIDQPILPLLSLICENYRMISMTDTQVIWGDETAFTREGGSVYDSVTLTGRETEPVHVILSGN